MPPAPAPLGTFISRLNSLVTDPDEARLLPRVANALTTLVADDKWLPDAYAVPHPDHYTQYLLYRDPAARFSVVSFVWGPGQGTPVHDHTIWGAVGVLRGAERSQRFAVSADCPPRALDVAELLRTGEVETVSPRTGDIHQVANAHADRVSVSIHAYGADIGAVQRHTYPATGGAKPFVSGYANTAATPAFDAQ
ncbi:cysteine dioxygenase [Polymorphobacter glacialis]|uniref:Cysteine dioxygenase n=1 Tax=Sandarakinorhabdus glacialis TaxID=1614636 RepID=A0A917E9L7_9SPHN|nr:cysteine dioxygenase [Polymorphobacter glacialis]GGE14208.1 cysteine dioxygenase [Polymorphobacter glacialis]